MAIHNKITKKEIEIISSGRYNAKELAVILGRHKETITKIARQIKAKLPKIPHKRKYFLNENTFSQWSESVAYWIGFICADGNISKEIRGGRTLTINLARKDENHISKLKNFLETNIPIYQYEVFQNNKKYEISRLSVSSKFLCDTLIEKGILENKTYRTNFPLGIPEKYISHFIRGYFDGDGSLTVHTPKISTIKNVKMNLVILKNMKIMQFYHLMG